MRVLQITNYMYPNIGGIEQVTRDVAQALALRGDVEQRILCFNSNAEDGEVICRQNETVTDTVDGVEVTRCGCFAKVSSQQLSASFGKQLRRTMDEFSPDVVVFHYPNPFEAFHLLRYRKRSFRLVVFWHLDITKQKILGKVFHPQSIALLKRADRIVSTCPNYIGGSPYLSRFKEKCTVISNCITEAKLQTTPEIEQLADRLRGQYAGKTLCLAVGRHVPYKGFRYLIDAAKQLDESFAVCLAGSGPLTEELKAQAAGSANVRFLGRLSEDELKAYYLACDVFCFSSITKNEAFGLALAEAMYYGKPAVTFTIPGSGVNYVSLGGVTGIECPNCDSTAYAAAIKRLAQDEQLRREYGENAHRRAVELFMFEQFSQNISRLIDSL